MEVSGRQRLALEAICESFCPSGDGLSSARELRVADALLGAVRLNPRKAERTQLQLLLAAWDSKPATALLGRGGWRRFSEVSSEQRERILLAWGESRVPQQRAAFQALRKGSLLLY